MNLLFTIDINYVKYLVSAVRSIEDNNDDTLDIYIISKDVTIEAIPESAFKRKHNFYFFQMSPSILIDAPVSKRYPEAIYYRIFASKILPDTIDRILYLDPDIIVKGNLSKLYNMEFGDNFFIATSNVKKFLTRFNQIKNHASKDTVYINTGVMMMNLKLLREKQSIEEVYDYIDKQKAFFCLPDQDIISTLYGDKVLLVDKMIYNLSDRSISQHNAFNLNKIDEQWVKDNAVIIHYYGTNKPWNDNYKGILKCYYDKYKD